MAPYKNLSFWIITRRGGAEEGCLELGLTEGDLVAAGSVVPSYVIISMPFSGPRCRVTVSFCRWKRLGVSPVSALKSRTKWAWSKYPESCAMLAQSTLDLRAVTNLLIKYKTQPNDAREELCAYTHVTVE